MLYQTVIAKVNRNSDKVGTFLKKSHRLEMSRRIPDPTFGTDRMLGKETIEKYIKMPSNWLWECNL